MSIIISSTKLQVRSGAINSPCMDNERNTRVVAITEHVHRAFTKSYASVAYARMGLGTAEDQSGSEPSSERRRASLTWPGLLWRQTPPVRPPSFRLPLYNTSTSGPRGKTDNTCAMCVTPRSRPRVLQGRVASASWHRFPAHSRSCQFRPYSDYYSTAF